MKCRAFTLIELLASVAIVGVLAALLIAAARPALRAADNTKCVSNLRQVATATFAYTADHDGTLPGPLQAKQGCAYRTDSNGVKENDGFLVAFVAPYIQEPEASTASTTSRNPKIFLCPAWAKEERARKVKVSAEGIFTGYPYEATDRKYFGVWKEDVDDPARTLPAKIAAIPKLSEVLILTEADGEDGSHSGDYYAPKPVHETHRNRLYLDGHVEGVLVEK